jgi:hypothetical protein
MFLGVLTGLRLAPGPRTPRPRHEAEEAAPVPIGGLTALHFFEKEMSGVGRGSSCTEHLGAWGPSPFSSPPTLAHVTGVCSTSNVELVKSLGADEVVDYTNRTSRKPARSTT